MSDLPYKNTTKITISPITFEMTTESSDPPVEAAPSASFMDLFEQVAKTIVEKLDALRSQHLCGYPFGNEGLRCQLPAGHEGPHQIQGVGI